MAHTIARQKSRTHDDQEHDDNSARPAIVDTSLQRSQYGGFHFGAAFFGWLVSTGLGTILTALLAAGGSAIAITTIDKANADTASTVGLVSGILLLVVMAISYYAGGYVAGRMARFDGGRQGVGVWLIGVILALILGGVGAAVGSQYNVLQQLNLPRLPIDEGTLTTGGLITLIAILAVTLLAAIAGGKQGEHFHNKIDETGNVGTVE